MGKVVCPERVVEPIDDPRALLSYGKRWYEDGTILGWETYLAPEVVEQMALTALAGGVTIRLQWQLVMRGGPSTMWKVGLAVLDVNPFDHVMLVVGPDDEVPYRIPTDRVATIRLEVPDPRPVEKKSRVGAVAS